MEPPAKRQRTDRHYSGIHARDYARQHNGDHYTHMGQSLQPSNFASYPSRQAPSMNTWSNIQASGHAHQHVGHVYGNQTIVLHRPSDEHEMRASFLDQMLYPSIDARRETVPDAARATFTWMLEPRREFAQWLVRRRPIQDEGERWLGHRQVGPKETNLFWMSGRAGSGKSTMMKYIYEDHRTRQLLQHWAGSSRRLITAQHFFWHLGTAIQKSHEGLLRSLLYQICSTDPGLPELMFPLRWRMTRQEWNRPWSTKDLWSGLKLLGRVAPDRNYCFFIDGLDEYHPQDNHLALAKHLLELADQGNVKVVCAGRPWPAFEYPFNKMIIGHLRLENLTFNDLANYAFDSINEAREMSAASRSLSVGHVKEIANALATASQGVFLWARLVTSSICQRVTAGADYSVLLGCLNEFPDELEAYFRSMIFDRIHSTWRGNRSTAIALKLAYELNSKTLLHAGDMEDPSDILEHWLNYWVVLFPDQPDMTDSLLGRSIIKLTYSQIDEQKSLLYKKFRLTCGELLSCEELLTRHGDSITFSHRTIYDFLSTEDMQQELTQQLPRHFQSPQFANMVLSARCRVILQGRTCTHYFDTLARMLDLSLQEITLDTELEIARSFEQFAIWCIDNECSQRCDHHLGEAVQIEVMDCLEDLLTCLEIFLKSNLVAFAGRVLQHWPQILVGNQLVWNAAFDFHHSSQSGPIVCAVNLAFLKCLCDSGADARVGERAYLQSLGISASRMKANSQGSHDESEEAELFCNVTMLMLSHGARLPEHMQDSQGKNHKTSDVIEKCVPARRRREVMEQLLRFESSSTQAKIHERRLEKRRNMWPSILSDEEECKGTSLQAVWLEQLQQECLVHGVDDTVHTIGLVFDETPHMEEADLGIWLCGDDWSWFEGGAHWVCFGLRPGGTPISSPATSSPPSTHGSREDDSVEESQHDEEAQMALSEPESESPIPVRSLPAGFS